MRIDKLTNRGQAMADYLKIREGRFEEKRRATHLVSVAPTFFRAIVDDNGKYEVAFDISKKQIVIRKPEAS